MTGDPHLATVFVGTAYPVNLTTGRQYRWSVAACDSTGCSAYTTPLYFQTTGAGSTPPGGFSVSNQSPVCDTATPARPAVRLNWSAASGAATYDIYRSGAQIASGITDTTFYNSTGLTAGQSYSYFVRARNPSGTTDSNTINVSIPANICAGSTVPGSFTLSNQAPVCDTAAPVGPAVRLNWSASSGASTYEIYRGGGVQIASGVTGTTFYNSTGLAAGQSYSYFVRARNSSGTTDSNAINVSIPANICAGSTAPGSFTLSNQAPVCDTAAPVGPAVRLNWSASGGASTYEIYRGGVQIASGVTGATFYNSTGLTAGQSYSYFVRARNTAGTTDSNTINVSIPTNICAGSTVPGSFTLSNQTPVCDMAQPSGPAVRLNWSASSGATTYEIYRVGLQIASGVTGTTFYNSSGLAAGQSYSYFVRARNSAGTTDSNTINVSIAANICAGSTVPGSFTLSNQAPVCDTSPPPAPAVRLQWTPSANATSYDIYRDGAILASDLPRTAVSFYNSLGLSEGRTYSYLVRARNSSGSTDSNVATIRIPSDTCTPSSRPSQFQLSSQPPVCDYNQPVAPAVRLNWTPSERVRSYEVYRNSSKIYPPDGAFAGTTFYNSAGLAPGLTYTFFVRALNDVGTTDSGNILVSIPSNICTASASPGPFALSASPACQSVSTQTAATAAVHLSWLPSVGASSYDVIRDGATLYRNLPPTLTTLADSDDIRIGSTHTYRLTAINDAGRTDSNTRTITVGTTCVPPGAPRLSGASTCNLNAPQMNLAWTDTSSGVDKYDVYRNGILILPNLPETARSVADAKGLAPGQAYAYVLLATNAYGTAASNTFTLSASGDCGGTTQGSQADLSIQGGFTSSSITRYSDVTLVLNVRNAGPAPAKDTVVTLPTPPGTNLRGINTTTGYQHRNASGTVTVRIPLGTLQPGTNENITATFYVYAELGAALNTAASVTAGVTDPTPSNNSVSTMALVSRNAQTSEAEDLINQVQSFLMEPLPEFRGNWISDVVQQLYDRSAYVDQYLKGVNELNVAVNLLSAARRFLRQGDAENASRYARLARQHYLQAQREFTAAIDIYLGNIEKPQVPLEIAEKTGNLALDALIGLRCRPCILVKYGSEFAIDYVEHGRDAAFRNAVVNITIDALIERVTGPNLLKDSNRALGQSGLYESLLSATKNPAFSKQLMTVLAASLDLSVEGAEELVPEVIKALGTFFGAPVSVEPTAQNSVRIEGRSARYAIEPFGWPSVFSTGIVNAASYVGGGASPGEIVVVFGEHLGPESLASGRIGDDGLLENSAGGVRVLFDSIPAPLLYTATGSIGAVVPYAVAGRDSVQVQVEYGGIRSFPVEIPVVVSQPGVFSIDQTGTGQGAILNQDGTVNASSNSASKGSIVSLYATGEGQTEPWGRDGTVATTTLPTPLLPVRVLIGGLAAEIIYAGAAPGSVAGALQINARVPLGVQSGASVPVQVSIGDVISRSGITMAVR